ncbi:MULTISPECIES: spore cortex biosynthesis protein YabQ [unclassified Bacillus (in: firmicutes)]|uniref:spore cortex biosynthesis protein YabQ n=1 Tax=unclassified Bacillus (in: firmicutes) TaxID=185979 RepID=UPI0008EB5F84|nr:MULTISPECIES: spore cortex biosynthesis protein YabQ [unclassified Bacillus (in: firmicutes)]SFB22858.1 spore cortex biosynthesis protein YabQ [Bacillus sp. UNCCL13]SFQ91165.1 spore cortex biosynthesis protein YabQ [Bacillus sp. cl95]
MTLSTQFLTMLSMIGMGILFGCLLDTYQRFLKRKKRKSWLVFFNDLLFWTIQAMLTFYILFLVNQGELRFYIFLALLCGFAVYQSLLKGIYLRILEWIIKTIISIYLLIKKTVYYLIYKPIVGLFQVLIAISLFIGRGLYTLVKFILKVILFILKLFWTPVEKFFAILWKLLPKRFKKIVEKIYNKWAGNGKRLKNYLSEIKKKWKNRKKE